MNLQLCPIVLHRSHSNILIYCSHSNAISNLNLLLQLCLSAGTLPLIKCCRKNFHIVPSIRCYAGGCHSVKAELATALGGLVKKTTFLGNFSQIAILQLLRVKCKSPFPLVCKILALWVQYAQWAWLLHFVYFSVLSPCTLCAAVCS